MLIRLIVYRLLPITSFCFCKDRIQMKRMAFLVFGTDFICFCAAVWEVFCKEEWKGLLYLTAAMFPQGVFYGFAFWMIVRCLWNAWSKRVWKRIFLLAQISILIGVLMENYWNSVIIQKILRFFK